MIQINGNGLSINECVHVVRGDESVALAKSAETKIIDSNKNLRALSQQKQPFYGINTGFGIFADRKIGVQETKKLNRNLILSHAVGTGNPLDQEVVRAAMLIRANTLSKGYSGIRIDFIHNLLKMINAGVTPIIPSQGSLGSSGDLCQLAHLALVVTRDHADKENESGKAFFQGKPLSGKKAMRKANIDRLVLDAKEGLALINGATFSAAIAALAIWDAINYFNAANLALALSLEALLGCSSAFDPRIHQARNLEGQATVAMIINQLIKGSTFVNSTNKVQDAYSLRCAPQVHGAVLDTLRYVENIIQKEINAATDNPLIFNDKTVLSGGNFHGEPIALVMDFLAIAISELAAISERRIFRMTDGNLSHGLPAMLVDKNADAGVNSGLMMPHYTAASLVLENQTLAAPDSVHSLPTSANQEDHNSNSMTAARNARAVVKNLHHIIATEIYTAIRAIELRKRQLPEARLGKITQLAFDAIRSELPYRSEDGLWISEIEQLKTMINSEKIPLIKVQEY